MKLNPEKGFTKPSNDMTSTLEDPDVDSNEAKALVGKPMEEIKLRKLMK